MTNLFKGSFTGFSATFLIAIAMAIAVAGGMSSSTPLMPNEQTLDALQAFIITLGAGLVPGVLFGALLGSLRTRRFRSITFVIVGLLLLALCLPFWPDLAICAVPIVSVHALALAAWTQRR